MDRVNTLILLFAVAHYEYNNCKRDNEDGSDHSDNYCNNRDTLTIALLCLFFELLLVLLEEIVLILLCSIDGGQRPRVASRSVEIPQI